MGQWGHYQQVSCHMCMMQGIEKEVELIQETQEYSKVWYS